MTEINTFSNTRTSMSDFALDDHFGYQDVNELKANIDHDWEAFQKAHGADGEHKSWVAANNLALTQSGSDAFLVSGDFTNNFPARRRLKLDCGADGYKYRTVASASVSDGDTVVYLEADNNNELTANLTAAELSVIKEIEALPHWEAVWHKCSDDNILDASGDMTGPELILDFSPTRALVRAIGEGGLDYRLMGLNSLGDLLAVSGNNIIFYSGFSSTVKTSVSWATYKPKTMISLEAESDLYGLRYGYPWAIKCSGTDCNFSSYGADYSPYTPHALIYANAKLMALGYDSAEEEWHVLTHSGTELGNIIGDLHLDEFDGIYAQMGLALDNNGDMVVMYNAASGGENYLNIYTFSGTGGDLKSSLSFSAPEAFINFAYDSMRLAAYGNGSIYVYSDVRSSEVVASWSAAGIMGLGVAALNGVFENKKSLTPGIPVASLDYPGARVRLDIAGADDQVCQSVELSLAR